MRASTDPYVVAFCEYVSGIQYKPGWKMWAEQQSQYEGGAVLVVRTPRLKSVDGDGTTVSITARFDLDRGAIRRKWMWRKLILFHLVRLEVHEVREYLKRDGVTLFAPHDAVDDAPLLHVPHDVAGWMGYKRTNEIPSLVKSAKRLP